MFWDGSEPTLLECLTCLMKRLTSRMQQDFSVKIVNDSGVGKVGLRYAGPAAQFHVQMAHL